MRKKKIQIIGYASCYGAQDQRCDTGPITLQNLQLIEQLNNANFDAQWSPNITPSHTPHSATDTLAVIVDNCKALAKQTRSAVEQHKKIIVIGGDHSSAIGTWSGVHAALIAEKPSAQLGLIWIDAHMDSHTMASSKSGAIHGMPVASLLGHGDLALRYIESNHSKLQPQNLCLVGIRSFEAAEAQLLEKHGVKVFFMRDIHEHGLAKILALAKTHVTKHSDKYGISLDLDAIDPDDAPGVGSRENHGISGKILIKSLKSIDFNDNFIGLEVSELNSNRDYVDKTARLAINIILACLSSTP